MKRRTCVVSVLLAALTAGTVLLGAVFLLVAFSRLFQKSSRSRFFEKKLTAKEDYYQI